MQQTMQTHVFEIHVCSAKKIELNLEPDERDIKITNGGAKGN